MTVDSWALWSVASKFFCLLAMAGVVGGSFTHLLADRLRFPDFSGMHFYLLASTALGLLSVPLFFLLQVGGINQSGASGMFDPLMNAILLQSTLGDVLLLRLSGFLLMPAAVWLLAASPTKKTHKRQAGYWLCALSALLLMVSFVFTGHVSELLLAAKMLLALHVLAVLLWIGSLYPLLYLSGTTDPARVQRLMRGFGALALCLVAALIVAGVYLATQLLQAPTDLVTTSYGLALLLKLSGVSALLLLAGLNKLVFVPGLLVRGVASLQSSIRLEIAVALYVVAVTSWLTTVTGPASA